MFFETIDDNYLLSTFATNLAMEEHISIQQLQKKLNYQFKDLSLLKTALQHKSFLHEFPQFSTHHDNERMEFLGDAILDLIVSEELYRIYPNEDEGTLSKLRSFIVNEDSLFQIALFCGLDKCILLGKGEFNNRGTLKKSILSDALEATICAVYLDSNLECAKTSFHHLIEEINHQSGIYLFSKNNIDHFDPKTKLQNICMKKLGVLPEYRSTEDNNSFTVELYIQGKNYGSLKGNSKKLVIKELAQKALEQLDN